MRLLKREELLPLDKETLVEIILQLQEQVQALTKRVEELESQLHKNSCNSLLGASAKAYQSTPIIPSV